MQTQKVHRLTLGGIIAAVVFAVTWLVRIPIPVSGGAYLNLGDAAIFVCVYAVGGPAAAAGIAIGSALADLAAGAPVYALPTALIKAAMAVVAAVLMKRRTFGAYLAGCAAGGSVMVLGYALFELWFFGVSYALASLPFNLVQWVGSVLAAAALFEAARRLGAAADLERYRG